MQKTYTSDFLTKAQAENRGKLEQYFIRDDHPAIIPREEWDAVQTELSRREEFRKRHGIRATGSSTDDPFYQVFCAAAAASSFASFGRAATVPYGNARTPRRRRAIPVGQPLCGRRR